MDDLHSLRRREATDVKATVAVARKSTSEVILNLKLFEILIVTLSIIPQPL